MLTQEQIKNLKPGDPLVLHSNFNHVDYEGDIWAEVDGCTLWFSPSCISLPPEHGTSVPTPKHDPCRLFKKGDIVRLKEWNGRCPALPEDWKFDNGLFKVHEDEKFNSSVEITRENSKTVYIAPICFLELVTPVEELEPYMMKELKDSFIVTLNDTSLVSKFLKASHPNAKAAAEAERDRLNEEWRKEQNDE